MNVSRLILLLAIAGFSACAEQQPYPPVTDVTWGRGLCQEIHNSERCAAAIQEDKLGAAAGVIRVSEDSICFTGQGWSGCTPRAVGHPSWQSRAWYIGTFREPPYHTLWVQYFEGSSVRLVHAETGTVFAVDDVPAPSPDGSRFAVASGDLEAQYGPNRLTIWAVSGDTLVREWSVEPEQWEPQEVLWQSLDTIRLTRVWPFTDYYQDTTLVIRTSRGWALTDQK